PQLNHLGNNFPYTFFGLEPGTTKEDIRRCLERWNEGDNGILNYSKAYRLQPGTGWLVPPCVLHAPGSLVTYEPQWGSDVFAMYQSMVEGGAVFSARKGHAEVDPQGPRRHRRAAQLGRQRQPAVQGQPLHRADRRSGRQRGGLRRQVGRLRQDRRRAALLGQGADGRPRRE